MKREFMVKVISLHTRLTFCYAVVSKLGRVGVYDGEFNLLDAYKIGLKPTDGRKEFLTGEQEERRRRSVTTWVTDAVFVPDIYAIFFSASDRSLHLYDATGLIHVPLCLISGLKNTPTCLDYYTTNERTAPSFLFFGDDQGDVTVLKFHQPKKSLFRKKDPDKLDKFLWTDLKEQPDYVTVKVHPRVHADVVQQVAYSAESKTIQSCSNDPVRTMVLLHMEKRRRPYVFQVPRGITRFHLDNSLHIIVTGSGDGLVRVWNRVVTKRPIITLHGHRYPIVDVRILKHMSVIISLSKKGIVKIWNLNNYHCQMTLNLNFPILKTATKEVEFGARSIYPGPLVSNVFDTESGLLDSSREPSKISSFTEGIETWLCTRDFEIGDNQEWNRSSVIIICCDQVAFLKLNSRQSPESDALEVPAFMNKYRILPPPSRELYASIPSPWKIADSFTKTPPEESEGISTVKSSSSSSARNMAASRGWKTVQTLTADPVTAPMRNMNARRAQLRMKHDQMKMLVYHCAPHLALDLYDLAPVKFSRPLPVTRKMLEEGIDVSDPEHLLKGKSHKESAASTSGETFSDTLSPRSTKSSKLNPAKKNLNSLKGRRTPDWFNKKIKTAASSSSESEKGFSAKNRNSERLKNS